MRAAWQGAAVVRRLNADGGARAAWLSAEATVCCALHPAGHPPRLLLVRRFAHALALVSERLELPCRCEYPVSDRGNAVRQFFDAAAKDPSMIKASSTAQQSFGRS